MIYFILDVVSTYSSRGVLPQKRNCLFYNEREMSLYENYTRSNCQMECSLKYTRLKCGCQPYFYPCKYKNCVIIFHLNYFFIDRNFRLFYDYDVICNYIYSTFNADYGGSGKICGLGELSCLQKISKDLRKISQGNNVALQELRDAGIDCECPAGNLINVKLNKQN